MPVSLAGLAQTMQPGHEDCGPDIDHRPVDQQVRRIEHPERLCRQQAEDNQCGKQTGKTAFRKITPAPVAKQVIDRAHDCQVHDEGKRRRVAVTERPQYQTGEGQHQRPAIRVTAKMEINKAGPVGIGQEYLFGQSQPARDLISRIGHIIGKAVH